MTYMISAKKIYYYLLFKQRKARKTKYYNTLFFLFYILGLDTAIQIYRCKSNTEASLPLRKETAYSSSFHSLSDDDYFNHFFFFLTTLLKPFLCLSRSSTSSSK